MKLKTTLILLILVAVVGALWLWLGKQPTSEALKKQSQYVITVDGKPLATDEVRSVELVREGETILCARSASDPKQWVIEKPVQLRANRWGIEEGIIRKLVEMTKKQTLSPDVVKSAGLKDLGLEPPRATVTLTPTRKGAAPITVALGGETRLANAVHVKLSGADSVHIVADDCVDAFQKTVNDLRSTDLLGLSFSEVERMELTVPAVGGARGWHVVCVRADGVWTMETPVNDLADAQKIRNMVEKFQNLGLTTRDFVESTPAKRHEFGLDAPRLTLSVSRGKTTQTVLVGGAAAGEGGRIHVARKDEPTIARVRASLLDDLRKRPEDLRDRSLARFDTARVTTVKLDLRGRQIELKKNEQNDWLITTAPAQDADDETVAAFLRGLQTAEITDFVDDRGTPPTKYGLDAGHACEITLMGKDDQTFARVLVGAQLPGKADRYYVRRGPFPCVYAAPGGAWVQDAVLGRYGFVNHILLEFAKHRIERLELTRPTGDTCAFEKVVGRWKMLEPVQSAVDEWSLNTILFDVSRLKAARILGPVPQTEEALAKRGLAKSAYRIAVTYKESAPAKPAEQAPAPKSVTTVIRIGNEVKGGAPGERYAIIEGGQYLFTLPKAQIDNLDQELAAKTLSKFRDEEVEGLGLKSGGVDLAYERHTGGWQPANAQAGRVGTASALNVMDVIRDFEASGVASYTSRKTSGDERYGLRSPLLTITVKQVRMGTPKAITIGRPVDPADAAKGYYATGPDSSFILIAGRDDVQRLLKIVRQAQTPPKKAGIEK